MSNNYSLLEIEMSIRNSLPSLPLRRKPSKDIEVN